MALLINYILITVRNLFSNKLFSIINIFGLSVGLACVILIAIFVNNETSYDQHWEKSDRIYRVMRTFMPPGGRPELHLSTNAPLVGPLLKQNFPEFEQVVRILNGGQSIVMHPESRQPYYEDGIKFADPEIYQVFDIPLLQGDWETALEAPFQMVINETLARKYFDNENPIGQTLLISNQTPIIVSGVMQDLDTNTHLNAQAFISLSTAESMFGTDFVQSWGSNNFHTYIVTQEGYDIENFKTQIPDFLRRYIQEDAPEWTAFVVIPASDIHLHSQRENEFKSNGNISTVYTFSAIAIFILLIACFNFMNLSTAQSASRASEVGLRKTFGANRSQIIIQFLGESVILSLIAMCVAMVLAEVLLPWFNALLDTNLSIDYLKNPLLIFMLISLALFVGVMAGSYPAFYLSAFTASSLLKGELNQGEGGVNLRKLLVVVQFSISIALVIASGIALKQLRYAMNLDLGFTKEQVLIYRGSGIEGFGSTYQVMKQEILNHPEVLSVTAANLMPGDQNTNSGGIRFEGGEEPQGLPYLNVDYDFFKTFDIDITAGRSFSQDRGTDIFVEPSPERPSTTAAYILNKSAMELLGFSEDTVLNKWFEVARSNDFSLSVRGPIIGVADDIFFSSIHEPVKAIYYRLMEHDNTQGQFSNFGQMAIKVSGQDMADTLTFIESVWNQFLPDVPIQQSFLEQNMEDLYTAEKRQSDMFTSFSIIAIFVAGLGLFGLASYLTKQRTKEIGIRKVLGASILDIIVLLTNDFSKLVLLANILAWPVAWFFMSNWLESFAYRTSIGVGIFIFAALLAWLIGTITVGILAAKTAIVNPVESLRYE